MRRLLVLFSLFFFINYLSAKEIFVKDIIFINVIDTSFIDNKTFIKKIDSVSFLKLAEVLKGDKNFMFINEFICEGYRIRGGLYRSRITIKMPLSSFIFSIDRIDKDESFEKLVDSIYRIFFEIQESYIYNLHENKTL